MPSRPPSALLLPWTLALAACSAPDAGTPAAPVELIPTAPAAIVACTQALGTTWCAASDASAAAAACTARLTPAESAGCDPTLGCFVPYTPSRTGACVAGPTYGSLAACATPVADNCAFYRSCLDAAHPCGPMGYALGFGEPLCYLFINDRSAFTPAGQRWLQGVRTCLQRALAPLVAAPVTSCDALATQAYASHTTCYTAPGNSFCDLDPADQSELTSLLLPYLGNPQVTSQVQAVAAICAGHTP